MVKTDTVRTQLTELVRAHPFNPFLVCLDNGREITIEHPENCAFDSNNGGLNRLFIISNSLVHHSTLSSVSNIVELDRGQTAGV